MLRLSHSGISAIERCPFILILKSKYQRQANSSRNNLHKLNTMPGYAIHLAIEEFINCWKENPSICPRPRDLSEYAFSILNNIWEHKETQILEIIHSVELDETINYRKEQLRKIKELCRRFCIIWNNNGYQNMHYISHEILNSHPYGKYTLIGEIDLLLRDDDGIYHVIDWKSGIASRVSLGRSQLGIYAFLTHHTYNVDFNNIRCIFISLKEGSSLIREFKEKDLKLLGKRIKMISDIEEIYDTEQYSDSEWARPNEQNCMGCLYSNPCKFNYFSD